MKTTKNSGIYLLAIAATMFFIQSCAPIQPKNQKVVHKMEKIEVKQKKLDAKYKDLQQQQKSNNSSNRR